MDHVLIGNVQPRFSTSPASTRLRLWTAHRKMKERYAPWIRAEGRSDYWHNSYITSFSSRVPT